MLQTPIKPYVKPEPGDGGEEVEEGKKKSLRRKEGERLAVKEEKSDAALSGDEEGRLCEQCDMCTCMIGGCRQAVP